MMNQDSRYNRRVKVTEEDVIEDTQSFSIMPVTDMPIADMNDDQYNQYKQEITTSLEPKKSESFYKKLYDVMNPEITIGDEKYRVETEFGMVGERSTTQNLTQYQEIDYEPEKMGTGSTDPNVTNVFKAALIKQKYSNHTIFYNSENELLDPEAAAELKWANEVDARLANEKQWLGSRPLYEAEELIAQAVVGQMIYQPLDFALDVLVFGATSKLIGGIAWAGKAAGLATSQKLLYSASAKLGSQLSREVLAGGVTAVTHEALAHKEGDEQEPAYAESFALGSAAGAGFWGVGYLGRWAILGTLKGANKVQHTAKVFMDSWNGWHTKEDAAILHNRGWEHGEIRRKEMGVKQEEIASTVDTTRAEPKLANMNEQSVTDSNYKKPIVEDPYNALPKAVELPKEVVEAQKQIKETAEAFEQKSKALKTKAGRLEEATQKGNLEATKTSALRKIKADMEKLETDKKNAIEAIKNGLSTESKQVLEEALSKEEQKIAIEGIKKTLKDKRNEMKAARAVSKERKGAIKELKKSAETDNKMMMKQIDEEIVALKTQLKDAVEQNPEQVPQLEQQIENLNNQKTQLEQEYQAALQELNQAEAAEVGTYDEMIKQKKQEYDALKESIKEYEAETSAKAEERKQLKESNEQLRNNVAESLIANGEIFDITRLHDAGLFQVVFKESGQAEFNKMKPLKSEDDINEFLISTYKSILDGKETIGQKLRFLINMFSVMDANKHALQNVWFLGQMMDGMIPSKGTEFDVYSINQLSKLLQKDDINKAVYNHIVKEMPLPETIPPEITKLISNIKKTNVEMILDSAQRGYLQHYRKGHIAQSHQANKLLAFTEEEWVTDMRNSIDPEKSKIWLDREGNPLTFASDADKEKHIIDVLKAIRENIIEEYGMIESNTISGIGSSEMRVLEFKDYDSWKMYQNKYGHGKNVLESEAMKINGRASKNAMLSMFGAKPFNMIKELTNHVLAEKNETLASMGSLSNIPQRASWWIQSKLLENMINFHFSVTGASKYVGVAGDLSLWSNSINNLGIAQALKNASAYPMIETPIAASFETSRLLTGNSYKRLAGSFTDYLKLSPDKRELAQLGAIYQLESSIFPNLHVEQLTDKSGKFLKNSKAALDTYAKYQQILNTTDFFHNRNKSIVARQFDGEIGWLLYDKTNWQELNPTLKESLKRWGVTDSDWNMLLNNRETVLRSEHPFAADADMADIRHFNFSSVDAMKQEGVTPELKNVLMRMLFAREKHISRAVLESSPSSTGGFLGSYGKRKNDVWATFIRNFTAFQGWAFKEAFNAIENLDFRTRGDVMTRMTSYMMQKFATGTVLTAYRNGIKGKIPDDPKTWAIEISSYMGIPFLSDIPKTFLADHSWHGGGIDEILGHEITQSALGKGTGKLVADATKLAAAAYQYSYKHDAKKAFQLLRYSLPESDYYFAGQLLMQRLFMDQAFANIDPAAYALFEQEKRKAKERGFRYIEGLEPGAFVK